MLIAFLNKYWRPVKKDELYDEMDLIDYNNCIKVAMSSGAPEGLLKSLVKHRADTEMEDRYLRWKKGQADGL